MGSLTKRLTKWATAADATLRLPSVAWVCFDSTDRASPMDAPPLKTLRADDVTPEAEKGRWWRRWLLEACSNDTRWLGSNRDLGGLGSNGGGSGSSGRNGHVVNFVLARARDTNTIWYATLRLLRWRKHQCRISFHWINGSSAFDFRLKFVIFISIRVSRVDLVALL
jgi:hypothetical protein